MEAAVTALFDEATNTVSYIVADPATAKAAIVDCVLDFNPKSARTSTCSADRLIEAVRRQDLEVEWILETQVHANHLSAAPLHQGEARGPYRHRRGGPRRAGNLQAHLQSRAGLCHRWGPIRPPLSGRGSVPNREISGRIPRAIPRRPNRLDNVYPLAPDRRYRVLGGDDAEWVGRERPVVSIEHERAKCRRRLSSGLARPKSDGLHGRPPRGWCRRQ